MEKYDIFAVYYKENPDSEKMDYQFITAYSWEGAFLKFEMDYKGLYLVGATKCNVDVKRMEA